MNGMEIAIKDKFWLSAWPFQEAVAISSKSANLVWKYSEFSPRRSVTGRHL